MTNSQFKRLFSRQARRRSLRDSRLNSPAEILEDRQLLSAVTAATSVNAAADIPIITVGNSTPGKPQLTGPLGTVNNSTPTITWQAVPNAATYDVLVYDINRGAEVVNEKMISGTSLSPLNSLGNSRFQTFVRGVNPAGQAGAWSEPLIFDVQASSQPLGTPQFTGPQGTTNDNTPTITWQPATGAATYELIVYDIGRGQQALRAPNLPGTSFTPSIALLGAEYQAFVRAKDTNGLPSAWSRPIVFEVHSSVQLPGRPVVTAPVGTTTDDTPTIRWQPATGAAKYDLLVYNVDRGSQVISASGTPATSYTHTSSIGSGRFQVFVRGVNSAGQAGSWSTPFRFDVQRSSQPLTRPQWTGPAGVTVADATPELTWNSVPGAASYEINVYDKPRGFRLHNEFPTSPSFTPSADLPANTTIQAFVRAIDANGNQGPWSAALEFTVVNPPAQPSPDLEFDENGNSFVPVLGTRRPVSGKAIAVGDFNGDGFQDLVVNRGDYGTILNAGAIEVLYGSQFGLNRDTKQIWHQDSPRVQGVAEANDGFGTVLAVGDFNGDGVDDLAIGVPGEDVGNITDAGAVNVFYGASGIGLTPAGRGSARTDQIWDQRSTGIRGIAEAFDRFGAALTTGDFNKDGFADLAIGVPGEDVLNDTRFDAGAVNVIYGSASGLSANGNQIWDQGGDIRGIPESGDAFGSALAAGDFDGDGVDDLAIGVPGEDVGSISDAGAVNVIFGVFGGDGLDTELNQILDQGTATTELKGAAEAGDRFGTALAAGDFNRDGKDDLAIGIPGEDVLNNTKVDAGAVSVVYGSGLFADSSVDQFWSQATRGVEGAAEDFDQFGAALATGDFDNDGYDDLAIGVPREDVGSRVNAGAVNVLYGSAHRITTTSDKIYDQNGHGLLDASDTSDRFGAALATGDFNGDGRDDLAIHVPGETIFAGAANLVFGSPIRVDFPGSGYWSKDDFEIQLVFDDNGLTEAQQQEVQRAANRWSEVIVGNLPSVDYSGERIDDLLVRINVKPIDGSPAKDNSLAEAAPVNFRSGSSIPFGGFINFDSADFTETKGLPATYVTALHELGHTLGFVPEFLEERNLIVKPSVKGGAYGFKGSRALAEYKRVFGITSRLVTTVPMDTEGGHWDESKFKTEIMTPNLDANAPLSSITIAALADMGYKVDLGAADAFSK